MNRVAKLKDQTKQSNSPAASSSREGGGGKTIVVFGSCFLDYIAYVDQIPGPGQTLGSESFAKGFGGKGANQAVMAARIGAKTRMVAFVGDDGDGADYIANFNANGVDTTYVKRVPGSATGLAMISVSVKTAENAIVICPNAAAKTTFDAFFSDPASDPLKDCGVLICQNEIPLDATLKALKLAHSRGIYTIFNTAPAPNAAQIEQIKPFLKYVSMLCPNEHEAALMTGLRVEDHASAVIAAKKIQSMGVRDVVITLGKNGATVVTGTAATHVPGVKVKAVDTTGAGDSFVGSLAHFMSTGSGDLVTACKKANVCAAQSVTKRGTQSSYPTRAELPASLFD